MDRAKCQAIRDALDKALKAAGFDGTLKVVPKVGNAKFSGTNVTFSVDFSDIATDGTVQTKDATNFTAFATAFGLEVGDLGKSFTQGAHRYEIIGLKPGASRFPILGKRRDGKVFKFPVSAVQVGLGRKSSASRFPDYEGADEMAAEARVS